MDFQALINSMNQSQSDTRANYHLTYGQLVDALKTAPKDAKFDKRIKGIGSWRGSYIEIALFKKEHGLYCQEGEFNYLGDLNDYSKWEKEHSTSVKDLPTNANELGELLESIIGKNFIGYKGGNFTITKNKPLWLETADNTCDEVAIIGIDKNLKLITKATEVSDEQHSQANA